MVSPSPRLTWLPARLARPYVHQARKGILEPQCAPANASPRRFNQQELFDTTPLPDSIPKVKELGASSAPLMSASFFIGARCRAYNDDYMQCKTENPGTGEMACLSEGRRVTRCARSVWVNFSPELWSRGAGTRG